MKQVRFEPVKMRQVVNELKLIGKISFDLDKVVKIYPLVSGEVVNVNAALGDYVKQGQELAVIHSTEIAGLERDLISAKADLAIAEKNLSSVEDMYNSKIASEKDYIAAQKAKEKAQSELQRVNTILSIYGGKDDYNIVKSPVSGYIVEKFINPSMQIRPDNGTNMFTISALEKLWVLANVYESDIRYIHTDEEVEVKTISYPDKIFKGTIDKIYNVLDPDSKTMPVRIQLNNKENLLKPGMFAEVLVREVTDSSMLAVPSNSVVFDQSKYWVVVYRNQCDVAPRVLDIVKTTSRYAYIRSGVKENENVLTADQLLIYSAINH